MYGLGAVHLLLTGLGRAYMGYMLPYSTPNGIWPPGTLLPPSPGMALPPSPGIALLPSAGMALLPSAGMALLPSAGMALSLSVRQ